MRKKDCTKADHEPPAAKLNEFAVPLAKAQRADVEVVADNVKEAERFRWGSA